MKNILKKATDNGVITAMLSLIYGIVLIIWPDLSAKTLGYVIGIAIILVGLVYVIHYFKKDVLKDFYKRELVYGLCAIAIGILALLKVELIESIIPVALGIVVMYSGFVKLQEAFDLLRLSQKSWVAILILALLNIAFGVILLCRPVWVVNMLFRIIGIGLTFSGATDLITIICFTTGTKSLRHPAEPDIIDDENVI